MEFLLVWLTSHVGTIVGVPVVGAVVGILLKRFMGPKTEEVIYKGVYGASLVFFSAITVALNKGTGGLWNKVIEPYFKVLGKVLLKGLADGLVDGLDSDNNNSKFGRTPPKK